MSDIWITSDTHFGHSNILTFTDYSGNKIRPGFSSMEEMDEIMIQRWNARIKPNDKVYHLGDVFFNGKAHGEKILPRLNGKKRLFLGNHDHHLDTLMKYFDRVESWKKTELHGMKVILSHVPSHTGSIFDDYVNIHGHIHSELTGDASKYVNVCVEHTNYYPVNLDEIESLRKTQASLGKIKGHRNQ